MWPTESIAKHICEQEFSGRDYSIVVLDIDFFLRFCRSFNNEEIRDIVKNITVFFQMNIPQNAHFWKSNGDEFLLFYPDMTNMALKPVVDKLRKDFRKQKFAQNTNRDYSNVVMTFSAGIASAPEDGENPQEIIRKATVALYLAKAFRRNRVFVSPDSNMPGKSRQLFDENLKVEILIGDYGEIGTIDEPVPYAQARLWEPQAIDLDADGNLYIVDQNNHSILKFDGTHIRRIAGNGFPGYSGDNGPAKNATLSKPTGLAISEQYLYITDTGNDVVRRVHLPDNVIDTVAGTGSPGYSGDNGPASEAQLNKPGGAAVDQNGNLFINDIVNNVIRKVDPNGIITTYAGTGGYGFHGDGQPAAEATFSEIYWISCDKITGDLYLADYFNHCIRRISAQSKKIETIIGCGIEGYAGDGGNPRLAHLSRPVSLHIDNEQNIYVAESGNSCIRFLAASNNTLYTLVGDGEAGIGSAGFVKNFRLANPNGIVRDQKNRLYILDGANNRICTINLKHY